jgi:hypothetical protein
MTKTIVSDIKPASSAEVEKKVKAIAAHNSKLAKEVLEKRFGPKRSGIRNLAVDSCEEIKGETAKQSV